MTGDDDFRVRPGRIRPASGPSVDTALRQVRVAVARAGGPSQHGVGKGGARPSTFGRGRAALIRSVHMAGSRRPVVVKARVVRHLTNDYLPAEEGDVILNVTSGHGKVFVVYEGITCLDLATG